MYEASFRVFVAVSVIFVLLVMGLMAEPLILGIPWRPN